MAWDGASAQIWPTPLHDRFDYFGHFIALNSAVRGLLFLAFFMFSVFTWVVASVSSSFLFMDDYYSIVWIDHVLFIHLSLDGYLDCFSLLARVTSAAVNICVQVFVWIPVLNSLGYILRIKWLDHMVILCLTSWGPIRLFATAAVPLYISTSNVLELQFLYILTIDMFWMLTSVKCKLTTDHILLWTHQRDIKPYSLFWYIWILFYLNCLDKFHGLRTIQKHCGRTTFSIQIDGTNRRNFLKPHSPWVRISCYTFGLETIIGEGRWLRLELCPHKKDVLKS